MIDNYLLSITDRAGNNSSINIVIEIHEHTFIDGICTGCGCSESLINNWDYIINEADKTVQLTNYKGESNDVIVEGTYKINGKSYNTILNSHYEQWNNYDSPFKNKPTISSIVINEGVISFETSGLFAGLSALNNVDISGLDTSNVKNMDGMFYECANISNLVLTYLDTSNVESMKEMFYVFPYDHDSEAPCFNDLNINSFNMSKVVDINGMFRGIKKSELDLSMLDLSNVTNSDYCFSTCKKLEKIILPPTLKILGQMCFYGTKLTSIGEIGSNSDLEIPNTVKYIGKECFGECEELESVAIPEGVETIGEKILNCCRNVISLTIPSTLNNFDNFDKNYRWSLFGGEFYNLKTLYYNTEFGDNNLLCCAGSKEGFTVYFGEKVTDLPNIFNFDTNGRGSSKGSNVSNVIINGNVEIIPNYFLAYEKELKSITLPNSLKTIASSAFSGCENNNLEITVPNEVTEIGMSAFYKVPQIYYNGSAAGSPWGALKVN